MSRLCSATFEQLFAFGATFFGLSNFKQLFPFRAIFEQRFTRVQTLQYEMFTCDRQLHFLLLTSKDPGYEVASFSVIFFYLIFKFFYDLCFVICKTFEKKTFSLYNSKQFIRACGNCIKLLIIII
jgi:hypothetical protein